MSFVLCLAAISLNNRYRSYLSLCPEEVVTPKTPKKRLLHSKRLSLSDDQIGVQRELERAEADIEDIKKLIWNKTLKTIQLKRKLGLTTTWKENLSEKVEIISRKAKNVVQKIKANEI